jgi:hypothetical protein
MIIYALDILPFGRNTIFVLTFSHSLTPEAGSMPIPNN